MRRNRRCNRRHKRLPSRHGCYPLPTWTPDRTMRLAPLALALLLASARAAPPPRSPSSRPWRIRTGSGRRWSSALVELGRQGTCSTSSSARARRIRDTWQVAIDGGAPARVEGAHAPTSTPPTPVFDAAGSAHGLRAQRRRVRARPAQRRADAAHPQQRRRNRCRSGAATARLVWRAGNDWYRWSAAVA